MKYLITVSKEVFTKLNEKPDWDNVWIIKDGEEDKHVEAINNFQDNLIENTKMPEKEDMTLKELKKMIDGKHRDN